MALNRTQRRVYNIVRENAPAGTDEIVLIAEHSSLDHGRHGVETALDELADMELLEHSDAGYRPTDPEFRPPYPGEL